MFHWQETTEARKITMMATLLSRARDLEDIELRMAFDPPTLSWQAVEEGEEEEERANTEQQQEVLEVVRQLRRANLQMVTDQLGGNSGTIWKQLNALWRDGLLERETSGRAFYYFLPNHNEKKEEPDGQLDFIKNGR